MVLFSLFLCLISPLLLSCCTFDVTDWLCYRDKDITDLLKGQEQIHGAVLENANLMMRLEQIKNPYIFIIFNEETAYRTFIEEYNRTPNDDEYDYTGCVNKTIERAQGLLSFVEEALTETMENKEPPKGFADYFWNYWGSNKDTKYVVVQSGLTFKPVIAYKVDDVKYNEKIENAAKVCTKVCAVGLKVSMLWNTGANITRMFGYPLPNISDNVLRKANDFFKKVNSSSQVADFMKEGEGGLDIQELEDFGNLLKDLEEDNKVCFYLGNEDKKECSGKKWSGALIRSVLQMKGGKRTISYISKDEAGKVGYEKDDVVNLGNSQH